jgi:hypothetical protein
LQKQEEINLYGIDGSKPGAAAAGVWLSHRVVGLHENGIVDYSKVADPEPAWLLDLDPHFNCFLILEKNYFYNLLFGHFFHDKNGP